MLRAMPSVTVWYPEPGNDIIATYNLILFTVQLFNGFTTKLNGDNGYSGSFMKWGDKC